MSAAQASTTAHVATTNGPAVAAALNTGPIHQNNSEPATEDKIRATKIKRDDRTIRLVKATWEPILNQFMDTPNNWIFNCEVLVGRRT